MEQITYDLMSPISLRLRPVEIKNLFDLAYGATWELALKYDPVYGPRFINLGSK